MSYKALYRSYRPQKFQDVVGQDHIVLTLQNIINQNKIGHAYLFAGPRGTGKTSVAHVFARELNKTASGELVFDSMDIIEIDAASNNGVSEVRSIIDNVNYAPSKAKYKVYIIDEVHMLTKGAFNALLKTLEEPPKHVVFIFATTEPHKIPVTILSRVQRFNFRRIDDETIKRQLKNVLTREMINFDNEAIKFVAKLAQGGMRDALSIADQSAAFGNGTISFEAISQVFGIISISNQIKLLNLAYEGKSKELMTLTSQFLNNGADIERLSSSLLELIKDFIVYKKTQDESLMSFVNKEEVDSLRIDVQYAYESVDTIMELINNLRFTSTPRQLFELSMLKLIRGEKVVAIEPVVKPIEKTDDLQINKIFDDTAEISTEEEIKEEAKEIVEQSQDTININTELDEEQSELENEILSTQEINLNDQTKTAEIDIMKLFETENNAPVQEQVVNKTNSFAIEEIINLLVQANREVGRSIKNKWSELNNYMHDENVKNIVKFLLEAKLISAGNNFMLLKSDKQYVVDGINLERKNAKTLKLLKNVFGTTALLFAINDKEFEIVQNEWKDLQQRNSLPTPKPIETMEISVQEKTKEEEYGSSLFGDLFSS